MGEAEGGDVGKRGFSKRRKGLGAFGEIYRIDALRKELGCNF